MQDQSFNASQIAVFQTSNVSEFNPSVESWSVWKERLEIHFCEINCTDDNVRKSILLKAVGAVAYNVLHSLCSPDSPVTKKYEELCEILDTQYTPPTIVFSERKKFHVATKNESVAEWYARVKSLALNCKFGTHLEAFVLNQFVMGLPSQIFERLCEEDENLRIQMALRKAMIMETKMVSRAAEAEHSSVNYLNKQKFVKKNFANANGAGNKISGNRSNAGGSGRGNGSRDNKAENDRRPVCSHCGWRNHKSQACKT